MEFRSNSVLLVLTIVHFGFLALCSSNGQDDSQGNKEKNDVSSGNHHAEKENIPPAHRLTIEPVAKGLAMKIEPNVKKYKLLQYRTVETRRTNRPKVRPNRVRRTTSTTTTTTNAPYMEDFSSVADFETMVPGSAAIESTGVMSQEAIRLSQLISDEDLSAFQRVMTVLARNQMQIDQTQATHSSSDFRGPPIVPAAPPRWPKTTEVPRTYSVKTSCKENSPCVYHVISDIYCMHNANPNNYFQCSPGPNGRGVWVERQCPGGLRFYENGECGLEIFQPDGTFGNEKSEIYSTSPKVPKNPVKQPITVDNEREITQPAENRQSVQEMTSRTNSPVPIASSVDLSTYTIDKFYPHFANAIQQQSINSNPIQPRIFGPQTNNSFLIDRQTQQTFGSFPMDYWKPSNVNPYSVVRPVVDNSDTFQRPTGMIQQSMTGPIWPTQRQIYASQQALYPYRISNRAPVYDPAVGYRYP